MKPTGSDLCNATIILKIRQCVSIKIVHNGEVMRGGSQEDKALLNQPKFAQWVENSRASRYRGFLEGVPIGL